MIVNGNRLNLVFIIVMLLFFNSGIQHAEVKKRILGDGTVQYYNSNEAGKESNVNKKHDFQSPYNNLIESISGAEGLDPYLVKCVIKVESGFKADAVSVAGAMGLMQIMPDIAHYYNVADPLEPKANLTAGIKHLKSLLNYFQNDVTLAVAAYHAGLGRVKKNMKIPPIQSTVAYVNDVMSLYNGNGKDENRAEKIKRLYKRINSEGVIEIYNR
ncbi:MAG: lytic transglycosylase domain-containing protein [Spirochaetota bacterium]